MTGSKLTQKTIPYSKNTWYDTNAFHLHTVSARSLIFNTMTGISLLCFGNSVAHAVVFFSELAIKHASRNTERQREATCVCWQSQLAPSVFGSPEETKMRQLLPFSSCRGSWVPCCKIFKMCPFAVFIFQPTDQLHLPPKMLLLQLKEKKDNIRAHATDFWIWRWPKGAQSAFFLCCFSFKSFTRVRYTQRPVS